MKHAVGFLDMFQLVQSSKRCAEIDCPDVTEDAMAQAMALDAAREAQPATCHRAGHESHMCHDCKGVAGLSDGLAARLEAGGITIPQHLL